MFPTLRHYFRNTKKLEACILLENSKIDISILQIVEV